MHRRARELLRHAFVALAAGGVQIGAIDRRPRIARRQNVVHAMATGAVGRHHRAALRGQPVIAVEVAGHAVAGHAELLRQPHALVAAGADVARNILLRHRRLGSVWRLDGVDAVAIRAGGRQRIAARERLPVNARVEGVGHIGVALAAGGCATANFEIGDLASLAGRISCAPWQSVHTAAFCDPLATARPCTLA